MSSFSAALSDCEEIMKHSLQKQLLVASIYNMCMLSAIGVPQREAIEEKFYNWSLSS